MMMVRDRTGRLSCFVNLIEAEEPNEAERRARLSTARGTWRLIVLSGAADWML